MDKTLAHLKFADAFLPCPQLCSWIAEPFVHVSSCRAVSGCFDPDKIVIGNQESNGAGDIILPAKGEVSSGDVRGLPSRELETAVRLLWGAADVAWPALGLSTMSAALRRSSNGLPLLAGLLTCSCDIRWFSHGPPHACEHYTRKQGSHSAGGRAETSTSWHTKAAAGCFPSS